jgi:hypothetical protein
LLFADADNPNRDKVLCYLIKAAANPDAQPAGGSGGPPGPGGSDR